MKPLLAHTGFSMDNLERGIWQQLDAMLVKDDFLPEPNQKSGALRND
jgi:hypothetical protein